MSVNGASSSTISLVTSGTRIAAATCSLTIGTPAVDEHVEAGADVLELNGLVADVEDDAEVGA